MNESAIDHNCEKHGCAKVCLDPKLHAFDDCFPGKIRLSDVDGTVERNGYILWMEWKIHWSDEATKSQVRQLKEFTRNSPKQIAICVVGDPLKMEVKRVRVIRRGDWRGDWEPCTLEDLKERFRRWFAYADGQNRMAA